MSPKLADRVLNRAHSLLRPGPDQALPILIEDNPSRDWFFPLTGEECLAAIQALPERDYEALTHLWMRRPSGADRRRGVPLAEFICGSGVRLIVMYPWRVDRRICFGRKRPIGRIANEYKRFGAPPFRERGWWYAEFSEADLRRFFVHVLFHEVGHHVDRFSRTWSKANVRQVEEFADQYAMQYTKTGAYVLDRLDERS